MSARTAHALPRRSQRALWDAPATRKAYRRVRYRKPPISALHHAFRCSQPGERGKCCTACPVRQAHCRNTDDRQIGRASCRERVCQDEEISVVAVSIKKTQSYEK